MKGKELVRKVTTSIGGAALMLTFGVQAANADVTNGVIVGEKWQIPAGESCSRVVSGEDDWWSWRCASFTGAGTGSNNFINKMKAIGPNKFLWSASGMGFHALEWGYVGNDGIARFWNAHNTVEDSDVVFAWGHGGSWGLDGASISGTDMTFVTADGKDLSANAFSKQMLLGDDVGRRGTSLLALASCAALAPTGPAVEGQIPPRTSIPFPTYEHDVGEDIWPRWEPTMRAGLRYVAATWNTIYLNNLPKLGTNFGANLAAGQKIRDAWRQAVFDADSRNDPAVLATGTSGANCVDRLNNMRATEFGNPWARLRGTQVTNYCWHAWW